MTTSHVHISTAVNPRTEMKRKLRCAARQNDSISVGQQTHIQFLSPPNPPHILPVLGRANSLAADIFQTAFAARSIDSDGRVLGRFSCYLDSHGPKRLTV